MMMMFIGTETLVLQTKPEIRGDIISWLMRTTTRTTMATTAMTTLSRSAFHCLSHLNLFSGTWRCFAVRSIYEQTCPDTPSPQSAVSSHATAILAFAHARKRGEREPELRPRRS